MVHIYYICSNLQILAKVTYLVPFSFYDLENENNKGNSCFCFPSPFYPKLIQFHSNVFHFEKLTQSSLRVYSYYSTVIYFRNRINGLCYNIIIKLRITFNTTLIGSDNTVCLIFIYIFWFIFYSGWPIIVYQPKGQAQMASFTSK